MQFKHYETLVDRMTHKSNLSLKEYDESHDKAVAAFMKHYAAQGPTKLAEAATDDFSWAFLLLERGWHHIGRPYFKVYPEMAWQLMHTKLSFNCAHVQSPYPGFAMMLPTGTIGGDTFLVKMIRSDETMTSNQIRRESLEYWKPKMTPEQAHGAELLQQAMEAKEADITKRFGRTVFDLFLTWLDTDTANYSVYVPLHEGENVSDAIDNAMGVNRGTGEPFYLMGPDGVRQAVTLAVACAMFAVNRHELVAPDIDREILVRKFPGGRSKASQKLAEEKIQREIAQVKGWKVGSEIDLPRPRVITQGHAPERGGELTCGHVRSGHMKMQPCGPRNQDRKLIFVAPTVVRPDLPIRAMHGYRIRTKGEKV